MPETRAPEGFGSDAPGQGSVDPRMERYLERRGAEGLRVRSIEPLAGDASTRRYYRVFWIDGTPTSSVLALMPTPFDAEKEPFLNVARLFAEIPVRIPHIEDVAGPDGVLLLEDCGDELLQGWIEGADSQGRETTERWYIQAIEILTRIQSRGAELEDSRHLPYGVAFDEEKLCWELEYFQKHFLSGFRGIVLSGPESDSLRDSFSRLAEEIAALPRVLCHRDYHSRNLMVAGDELVVLDFQDARMGPVSYDLVSLLRDSYVDLAEDFVEEMVARFASLASLNILASPGRLRAELDVVALQRNLKALGTFGYQCSVRGKDIYRRYVPRTLELVRANLSRNPRWDGLRSTLAAHLPELT